MKLMRQSHETSNDRLLSSLCRKAYGRLLRCLAVGTLGIIAVLVMQLPVYATGMVQYDPDPSDETTYTIRLISATPTYYVIFDSPDEPKPAMGDPIWNTYTGAITLSQIVGHKKVCYYSEGDVVVEELKFGPGYKAVFKPNYPSATDSDTVLRAYKKGIITPGAIYSRAGYDLVGWNNAPDGTGDIDVELNSAVPFPSDVYECELYAQWEEKPYNVKFDSNGGNGTMNTQTIRIDTPTQLSKNTFTRNGYHFAHWCTTSDGTGDCYDDEEAVTHLGSSGSTVNLYAIWEGNDYKVHFDGNGATGGTMADMDCKYGTTYNLTNLAYQRTGYKFIRWDASRSGGGVNVYDDGAFFSNFETQQGAVHTLYAQWEPIKYTIVFDPDGASGTMEPINNIEYGVERKLPKNTSMSKYGYDFAGWRLDSSTVFDDGATVSNLGTTEGEVVTLTAVWKGIDYTIEFSGGDKAGVTGRMDPQIIRYGEKKKLSKCNYALPGFYFLGWSTQLKSTVEYIDEAEVLNLCENGGKLIKTVKLYAQWAPNKNTFRFHANTPVYTGTMDDFDVINNTTALKSCAFMRDGYHFSSWNTSPDGTGRKYTDKEVVKNDKPNGTVIDLYVQWEGNQYLLMFEKNHTDAAGSGGNGPQTLRYGQADEIDICKFVYPHHVFKEWNSKEDGSGISYPQRGTIQFDDPKDPLLDKDGYFTLYAQWEESPITIHYDPNCLSGESMDDTVGDYRTDIVLARNEFHRYGYNFVGWNDKADGSGRPKSISTSSPDVYADQDTVRYDSFEVNDEVTLYAQWTPIHYRIDFDMNSFEAYDDPADPMVAIPDCVYDTDVKLPKVKYKRDHYTFIGWNQADNGEGRPKSDYPLDPSKWNYADEATVRNLTEIDGGSVKLFAQWEGFRYTVKFDGNGATSGSMANMLCHYDTTYTISAPGYARTGYIFTGWNYEPDGSGRDFADKATFLNLNAADAHPGGVYTLYAQWKPIEYTIKFDGNGATSGSLGDIKMKYDVYTTLPANVYKQPYHKFMGWNTNKYGRGTKCSDAETIKNLTDVDGSVVTLYAQWEIYHYTIKYIANLATKGSVADTVCDYDKYYQIRANAYERLGYQFIGWNTISDGTGTAYKEGQQVMKLSDVDGDVIKLYARWKENPYTISYNGNGSHEGVIPDVNTWVGRKEVIADNVFVRKGYTFEGWNTSVNGTGKDYAPGQEVVNLTYDYQKKVNLYAQWKAIRYLLNYKLNGGVNSPNNPDVYTIDTHSFTLDMPTKTGYTFMGWYTDPDYKTKITAIMIGSDIDYDLYAKWVPNTYKVRFQPNGADAGGMKDVDCAYDSYKTIPNIGFSKNHYDFAGWNTKYDGTGKVYGDGDKVYNLSSTRGGLIHLFAQWSPSKYAINYYLNGGVNNPSNPAKFTVTSQLITLMAPTRTGYIFDGWYADANCTIPSSTIPKGTGESKSFYAKWKPIKYNIKLSGHGETKGSMSVVQNVEYDSAKVLPANKYKKTGYKFKCWNTKKNGKGKSIKNKGSVKNLCTRDGGTVTLYAQWTASKYTVKFDGNGADSGKMKSQKITYGKKTKLKVNKFGRGGFRFKGWCLDKNGNGKLIKDKGAVKNLLSNGKSITLYAQWEMLPKE